jgi:hypothetical protein
MSALCQKRTLGIWTADGPEVYHFSNNFCTKTPLIGVLLFRSKTNIIASMSSLIREDRERKKMPSEREFRKATLLLTGLFACLVMAVLLLTAPASAAEEKTKFHFHASQLVE